MATAASAKHILQFDLDVLPALGEHRVLQDLFVDLGDLRHQPVELLVREALDHHARARGKNHVRRLKPDDIPAVCQLRLQSHHVPALLEVQDGGGLPVELRRALYPGERHADLLREVRGPEGERRVSVELNLVPALRLVPAGDFPGLPVVLLRFGEVAHHDGGAVRHGVRRRGRRGPRASATALARHAAHAAPHHAGEAFHASEEAGHAAHAAAAAAAGHAASEVDAGAAPATKATATKAVLVVVVAEDHRERVVPAEERLEDLVGLLEGHASARAAAAAALETLLAKLVVVPPLVGVVQDLIRLGDDLEVLLSFLLVVGVLVWVVLQRELLVSLRDLILCGSSVDAKDLVVVFRFDVWRSGHDQL
mmetsp:Transcript_26587/g.70191  ORF Transcript_26587/g.70191 Transcript_26587/m.70191 type:complete len:366 (+) Transcript_26587:196-1293(+)